MNPDFSLKYPAFDVRMRRQNGQPYIFDTVRKKWLVLTPEEWVRQHLVNYLIRHKHYPSASMAIEKELALNDLTRRYDLVVFAPNLQPYLIVECKAPYVALDQSVVNQALRYNLTIKAPFVMITNGISDMVYNAQQQACEIPHPFSGL